MKSFLGMLLVAGVCVLSLVTFQGEARAEEMVSSWYGPGLEGNVTASGEIFEPYSEYLRPIHTYRWAPSLRFATRRAR